MYTVIKKIFRVLLINLKCAYYLIGLLKVLVWEQNDQRRSLFIKKGFIFKMNRLKNRMAAVVTISRLRPENKNIFAGLLKPRQTNPSLYSLVEVILDI